MFDPSFLSASADGQSNRRHTHSGGSASHDDRCIAPSRTFLENLQDWAPFYGSGAPQAAYHGDQSPHDDSCLIGNGCIGLGLNSDQSGKGMPPGLLPASGLDVFGLGQAMLRQDEPMNAEYFQSQPVETAAQILPKADLNFLDAASVSMLSQASASQSPATRRPNGSSPDDAATEADACSSCDSQCPGSEGACSAGSCAPCAPCGPCGKFRIRPSGT